MIVSAAIMRDGKIYTGKRHAEIIRIMVADGCKTPIRGDEQGFVDDKGEFHTRHKSKNLAKRSGQISWHFQGTLLSENLW